MLRLSDTSPSPFPPFRANIHSQTSDRTVNQAPPSHLSVPTERAAKVNQPSLNKYLVTYG